MAKLTMTQSFGTLIHDSVNLKSVNSNLSSNTILRWDYMQGD